MLRVNAWEISHGTRWPKVSCGFLQFTLFSLNSAINKYWLIKCTIEHISNLSSFYFPTVNAELFSLTYGSMVAQIIRDYEEVDKINIQLEKMGYNIGVRANVYCD